jgi:hypothetical protein
MGHFYNIKVLIICWISGQYQEAESIIYGSFRDCVELDTVAYNTCIKSMLEAGALKYYSFILSLFTYRFLCTSFVQINY